MNEKEMIEKLLDKLKHEEFCELNCYGCHGDGHIDITCKTVRENFEKELLKYYQPIPPEGLVVLSKSEAQKYFAYKHIEPQIKGCLDRERELESENERLLEQRNKTYNIWVKDTEKLKDRIAELEEQRDRQAYIAEDLIQEKHRWTEQARQETVKEIIQDLYSEASSNISNTVELTTFQIKQIADKYGVKVEE